MPAYNAESYIDEAIKSILTQTYANLELIICDDASTDGTWDIINFYTKKDKRVRCFKNKKNLYIAGPILLVLILLAFYISINNNSKNEINQNYNKIIT